ncbi:MAG: hypothetical protein GXP62_05950 [Oligoflexia bacterium]|nr:hypothetical protein [Oligoflexia bacterium]
MNQSEIEQVALRLSIPVKFVCELCEAGILGVEDVPVHEHVVERVRVSWTLREELGVNLAGVQVALHLLRIIDRDRRLLAKGAGRLD